MRCCKSPKGKGGGGTVARLGGKGHCKRRHGIGFRRSIGAGFFRAGGGKRLKALEKKLGPKKKAVSPGGEEGPSWREGGGVAVNGLSCSNIRINLGEKEVDMPKGLDLGKAQIRILGGGGGT